MKFSVIIPVFCSANTLEELTNRTIKSLNAISRNNDYEIIFVDDFSTDNSVNILEKITNTNKNIKTILLNNNYGQHNAIICGIDNSRGDLIITIDDDLQNPPEEINKLYEELKKGYDVVYGYSRTLYYGLLRNFLSRLIKHIIKFVMGLKTATKISAFRIFKSELILKKLNNKHNVNIDVLLSWSTNSFSSVLVDHNPRTEGHSGYTISKLFLHAINMIIGFSTIPLRLSTFLGLFFSFFGFCILVYVIVSFIFYGSIVKGFYFLASIISIFSGIQLLIIGIMGEYISRIYNSNMFKPLYKIKKIIKHNNK